MFEVICGHVCAWSRTFWSWTFMTLSWSQKKKERVQAHCCKRVKKWGGKVIKTNLRGKWSLITEHSGELQHIKPLQIAPSQAYFIDALGAAVRNKEHIWSNCRSHVKIHMRYMLLYSKHMAHWEKLLSNRNGCIQLLYQNTATPAHSYPSLHLSH